MTPGSKQVGYSFRFLPGVVYGSWRFRPMQFTNALDPVIYGFGIFVRVFNALNFYFLWKRCASHSQISCYSLKYLCCINAYINVEQMSVLHSLTVALCCLLFSDSHRESTVGSDCFVHGSSRTRRPKLSGLPSGRGTCRWKKNFTEKFQASKNWNWETRHLQGKRLGPRGVTYLQESINIPHSWNKVRDERLQFVVKVYRLGGVS